ncbi:MAG: hypothetical protein RLN85_00175 [Pseudomonadales bacterium]
MPSGFNSVLHNCVLWGARAFVVLFMGAVGFAAGLILLSFADDLLQYQARLSVRTILYVGVGFGLFCTLVCMAVGYWLLRRRVH